ncbi:MAG TPA: PAS domain-containing protein [Terracidiphilus sp.]|nr:PAS domain-containing protein [Terracidiphilus sp.]
MATEVFQPFTEPRELNVDAESSTVSPETGHLDLPANTDSAEQRRILDALPVLVFFERAGIIVFANAEARRMVGEPGDEWVRRPIEEVLWGLFPGTAEPQTLLKGTRDASPFHATLPARNGRLQPVEGTYCITNAEPREAIIVAHPTGRERAPKRQFMEDVLASLPEAVVIEHSGHILYTNPAFTRMFGYSSEEASGGSLSELIVPEARLSEHNALVSGAACMECELVETVRRNKDGEMIDVHLHRAPLLVDGRAVGVVFTFRVIRKPTGN